jgi:hypothetical protein
VVIAVAEGGDDRQLGGLPSFPKAAVDSNFL